MDQEYGQFYEDRDPDRVYPVEWVVRGFLGTYPRRSGNRAGYPGKKILDVGLGDGRNVPLLWDLGMEVHGFEITEKICDLTRRRMKRLGIPVDLRVGRNASVPFEDDEFDYLLACHSCYYVDSGTVFQDNLAEFRRVLKSGGTFLFSVPMVNTYILNGAEDLGEGHYRITNDPYGVRDGTIFRAFGSPDEIEHAFNGFTDFQIGSCDNDFWGIEERVWIVVCQSL